MSLKQGIEMIKVAKNSKHFASGSTCPPLQKGVLRIYSMFFCPFAQRTRIVLNSKNINYETVNINLANKPDWFLKINPLGKVPTLELDGKIMYESMITCDYLNEVYPNPPLYPSDPWTRGVDKCLIEVFNSKVHPQVYKMHRNPSNSDVNDIVEKLKNELDFFETELQKRGTKFFFGNSPGMVDYAMFPWFEIFPVIKAIYSDFDVLTPDRFPKLKLYNEDMFNHEVVKSTVKKLEDFVSYFQKRMEGIFDYDVGCE